MPIKNLSSLPEISKHWFLKGYPTPFHLGKGIVIISAAGNYLHPFCTGLISHAYIH